MLPTDMVARLLSWSACLALLCSASVFAEESNVVVNVAQAGDTFTVEATMAAPVTLKTAWEVLVDFDHMTAILSNLTASKVVSRRDNTLIVQQEGVARYGLLSFSYQSEREVRLEPMKRIQSRNLSGSARRMESDMQLSAAGPGVQIRYHAEIVPDSMLARMFGASALQRQIQEQFQAMVAEMQKRAAYPAAVAAAPPSVSGD